MGIGYNRNKLFARGGMTEKDAKVIFNIDTYEIRYKGQKDKVKVWTEKKGSMMYRLGYSFNGQNFKTIKSLKEYYKQYVDAQKYAKGGVLSKSDLEDFNEWMEDGNVIKNTDGTYSTQDANFRNRIESLDDLKKYYKREFVGSYAKGGSVGKFDAVEGAEKLADLSYEVWNK